MADRGLTSGLAAEVVKNRISPILLVRFRFDDGDVCLWSGLGTIAWNGLTFTGVGWLGTVTGLVETSRLEANGCTFTLSNVPEALIALALTENYQNRPAYMWIAALDSSFNLIADPYQILVGKMDVMTIEEGGESGSISLTVENALISLERPNERRYTMEDQKKAYPGDTFFDQVAKIQDINFKWGIGP